MLIFVWPQREPLPVYVRTDRAALPVENRSAVSAGTAILATSAQKRIAIS